MRPSYWTPKWDNEPQNSENMVAFQEISDFERNPWIYLQNLDKVNIFFFSWELFYKRSRLSTSFFAQEPKTYHRLDRPTSFRMYYQSCDVIKQNTYSEKSKSLSRTGIAPNKCSYRSCFIPANGLSI